MYLFIKDFFKYISHPTITEIRKIKASHFIILLILNFILSACVILSTNYILQHANISKKRIDFTPFMIFWGISIAPVFEEIFFRLNLRLTKKNCLILFITLSISIIIMILRNRIDLSILCGCALCALIIAYVFFKRQGCLFYQNHFKYVFWISCLLFGLSHSLNFTGNLVWIILLSPIICAPQIIAGAFMGYIRMNYGFIYAILFHMLINCVILVHLIR